MPSILFVLTSATETLTGKPAGWFLPEAAHPYSVLSPHVKIDFASPQGPNPQVDPNSVEKYKDEKSVKFLTDEEVKGKIANAKKISEVKAEDYDAIFYVGGYGPAIDLAFDPVNGKLASDFWNSGKIVSAICHGPAALALAVDTKGKPIIAGRRFTGLSTEEESAMSPLQEVPFYLDTKLPELGGIYEKADALFGVKVVVDGRLITGQNPASGVEVGEAILKALTA